MYFKLPALICICVLTLPSIESRKSKHDKSSEEKPDKCEFLGYDGPEDDGKHNKKNKVRLEVKGPVVSVFTPFTDDGEINYSVIPEYVEYLNSTGATAILVEGKTGEGFSQTVCERKKVTETFVQAAKKYNIKVIVYVGFTKMPLVFELASHAEKLGVAGIVTSPPIFSKLKSIEDLIWYLSVISKYAPSLPLLYFHDSEHPAACLNKNIREFHTKLTDQVENYKGMLTSFLVALEIADLVKRDQEIFIVSYHVASPAFMGFDSSISAVHNVALEEIYEILKAVKTGAIRKARTLQLKLNKIAAETKVCADIIPATKASMEMTTNIEVGPMREPQHRITDEQRKCVREALESNGVQIINE